MLGGIHAVLGIYKIRSLTDDHNFDFMWFVVDWSSGNT